MTVRTERVGDLTHLFEPSGRSVPLYDKQLSALREWLSGSMAPPLDMPVFPPSDVLVHVASYHKGHVRIHLEGRTEHGAVAVHGFSFQFNAIELRTALRALAGTESRCD